MRGCDPLCHAASKRAAIPSILRIAEPLHGNGRPFALASFSHLSVRPNLPLTGTTRSGGEGAPSVSSRMAITCLFMDR